MSIKHYALICHVAPSIVTGFFCVIICAIKIVSRRYDMAIKIRRPAFYKTSNTKNFTDRSEPRKAFWDRYEKMVTENSSVITF